MSKIHTAMYTPDWNERVASAVFDTQEEADAWAEELRAKWRDEQLEQALDTPTRRVVA